MAVVGSFATREQAAAAVDGLLAAGVPADAVSAVTPSGEPAAITTTSGRFASTASSSESRSPHEATTSMPGSVASSCWMPSLTMRLSSPRATVMATPEDDNGR